MLVTWDIPYVYCILLNGYTRGMIGLYLTSNYIFILGLSVALLHMLHQEPRHKIYLVYWFAGMQAGVIY